MPSCPVPGCATVIHESSPFCLQHLSRLDSTTQTMLLRAQPGSEPYESALRIAWALLQASPQTLFDYTQGELAAELERELEVRQRVYPQWVRDGKLKQREADHRIAKLRQIRAKGFTPP